MKKKYLIVPAIALVVVLGGAGIVSAHGIGGGMGGFGHWQKVDPATAAQQFDDRLASEASLLGITLDEMKAYWSQGKNINDIATENGITKEQLQQKIQATRLTTMKDGIQVLVSQGKITQAQADARIKFMTDNTKNGVGKMMGGMRGRGFGKIKTAPVAK